VGRLSAWQPKNLGSIPIPGKRFYSWTDYHWRWQRQYSS